MRDVSREFVFLYPEAEGVETTRRLYREKLDREITEEEMREVPGQVMWWR